jgi:hypothetical protein
LEIIQQYELAIHIDTPDTQLNVFRQAFLLLVTAFDAAVFDLVRVALTHEFFPLIGQFAKQDKLSFQAFSAYTDFDAFCDDIIESQLKARYLKDLLILLNSLAVPIADPAISDGYARLIELVLRRNIHVHNRGVVDERYLQRDERGKAMFNVFSHKLGDLAVIDEEYWESANAICRHAVSNLAEWVTSKQSA